MGMTTTLAAVAALTGLLLLCRMREVKPRELGEVKMVPYTGIIIICLVGDIALLAHVVALLVGGGRA